MMYEGLSIRVGYGIFGDNKIYCLLNPIYIQVGKRSKRDKKQDDWSFVNLSIRKTLPSNLLSKKSYLTLVNCDFFQQQI